MNYKILLIWLMPSFLSYSAAYEVNERSSLLSAGSSVPTGASPIIVGETPEAICNRGREVKKACLKGTGGVIQISFEPEFLVRPALALFEASAKKGYVPAMIELGDLLSSVGAGTMAYPCTCLSDPATTPGIMKMEEGIAWYRRAMAASTSEVEKIEIQSKIDGITRVKEDFARRYCCAVFGMSCSVQ